MRHLKFLCLWALILTQADTVQCDAVRQTFLSRSEGDTVVLSCEVRHTSSPPIGVYLRRTWLRPGDVLFKYEGSEVSVLDQAYANRTRVSGDPNIRAINVTISDLRASDTDRYHCEFNVDNPLSADSTQRGDTDFVLLVSGGVVSVDRDWVNTCAGGSILLPCVPPVGDNSAVEGVVLKRQRGQRPVELLYHSKHTSSSSLSVDRVQLSTASGPGGISYSLTVEALQPEDSGLYSCQLLLQGRPHSPSMGPQGLYVSVQGDQCGCSSYSTLIYALSAAVAVTFVLLIVVLLVHKANRPRQTKATHNPAPIYEEMTGLQTKSPKFSRAHTEEPLSEYRNIAPKNCSENHYESPRVSSKGE